MSDVLVFVQNPDGTLRAVGASSTTDGLTVASPGGTNIAVPATPVVDLTALSFLQPQPSEPDLQILFPPVGYPETVLAQTKLTQRFLLHLMTPAGSMLYRPEQGSRFAAALQQGGLKTEADVFSAFAGSMPQIAKNMQAEESASDDPDGRLGSAAMTQLTISAQKLSATVTVKSLSGQKAGLQIPLDFLI